MDSLRVEPRSEQAKCPYCHEVVAPADEKAPCLSCMAWHHRACRDEHGACAACGAQEGDERARPARALAPVSVAVEPWLLPEDGWRTAEKGTETPAQQAQPAQPTPIGAKAILYYFVALLVLAALVHVLAR